MKKTFWTLAILASLTGCAVPGIGDKQADTPPRIVVRNAGQSNEYRTWDNPSAFGPVPESLLAVGAKVCGSLDNENTKYKALGYHAGAQNVDGQAFPSGGYYCVPNDK